jgi:hypothetical protein
MKRHPLLHALTVVVLATTSPALAQPQYFSVFNSAQVESHCACHRNCGRYRDGDHACLDGIFIRSRTANRIAPCASGEGSGSGCAEA